MKKALKSSNNLADALKTIKESPRVALHNIRPAVLKEDRKLKIPRPRRRGRDVREYYNNWPPLGWVHGESPLQFRTPKYPYYSKMEERPEFYPVSLFTLQYLIDMGRLNPTKLIDFGVLSLALRLSPNKEEHYTLSGIQITEDGIENFKTPLNIEVQYIESEKTLAAIEKVGGRISTAFYDKYSLKCLLDPWSFFEKMQPIPPRVTPPSSWIRYYTNPDNRGYLCSDQQLDVARKNLAIKHNYALGPISDSIAHIEKKNPRCVFHKIPPGSLVNLVDKTVIKLKKTSPLFEIYNKPIEAPSV